MDRKQFLKSVVPAGVFCCGSLLGRGTERKQAGALSQGMTSGDQEWIPELERRMIKGSESPGWVKAEKAEFWIKALMENMDAMVDRETKIALMQACGKSCFCHAFGVADENKPSREELDKYLSLLEQRGIQLNRVGSLLSFTFSWGRDHQNPWGLTMRDGYCMCPLVESGPPGLSPSYCYCSTGYVRESFERQTGKPVSVELLDSLKMGGKDCVFKVTIAGL